MKSTSDLLQRFFELTGNESDSLIYLKSYRSLEPERFCLIYLNTEVTIESFTALFYDLKILYSLNLYPVFLVSQDSISYIRLFFQGIFTSEYEPKETDPKCEILFYSNFIKQEILKTIQNKSIPFVVMEKDEDLFRVAPEIVNQLLTSKFLYLSPNGSIKKQGVQERISIINLRNDYFKMKQDEIISNSDQVLLDNMKELLENKISHTMNIAITSPVSLFKELFTVNGSGTFIKLGSEILHLTEINQLNRIKLNSLLESAFRKKIHPQFLDSKIDSIFLETNYRGAAMMKYNQYGVLLSKFAVDEIARGEGIGRDIWNEMRKKHRTIFWRAKPDNPIHKWYSKECQGMDKGEFWNVYWINLEVENIPEVCKFLRSQSQDFIQ